VMNADRIDCILKDNMVRPTNKKMVMKHPASEEEDLLSNTHTCNHSTLPVHVPEVFFFRAFVHTDTQIDVEQTRRVKRPSCQYYITLSP
jgi:hypothetical protein